MFFLGVLGVIQVLFLPGIIFTSIINFPKRFLERFFITIAASMVINYCLVLLLTVCHIFVRPVILVLVLVEIGVLIWLNWHLLNAPIEMYFISIQQAFNGFIDRWRLFFRDDAQKSAFDRALKFLYIFICLLLAGVALKWIWKLFAWNLGSVFDSYDTVAVWNRWALNWAQNKLPNSTYRYPQLLPANWSLMYLIMGNSELQFFAKSYMPLFTLFILVMMVDLGFRKKNAGYFIGTVITYLVLKKFLGAFLIEGLADMPTTFFAFTALYFLSLHYEDQKDETYIKNAALGVLAGAGAGVTKQVGLVFFALFCVIFFFFVMWPLYRDDRKKALKIFWIMLAIIVIVVVPWYSYKQISIWLGLDKSEVEMVVGATNYVFRSEDIPVCFREISQMMGKYFYLFMLVIPFALVIDPLTRAISLLIALPIFVSWGIFASYDFRNLAVALPIFGMCTGLSFQWLVDKCYSLICKIKFEKIKWAVVLIILLIIVVLVGKNVFPDDLLLEQHSEKVMQTFSASINQKLLDALAEETGDYQILTNYPMDYLPGLQGHKHSSVFTDYQSYLEDISDRSIDYLLVPNYADRQILDDIEEKIKTGDFQLIFEDDTWIPYQFINTGNIDED